MRIRNPSPTCADNGVPTTMPSRPWNLSTVHTLPPPKQLSSHTLSFPSRKPADKSPPLSPPIADRPIPKTHTPAQEIRDYVAANLDNDQVYAVQAVMCDEWSIDGATVVPKETTLRQREKYFGNCRFSTLQEVLQRAKGVKGVV